MSNLVKRLNDTLPNISTPMMEGDNLAIVLCTAFDDGREETADDNGWSIAARNGYEEVIAAIRNHYKPAADTITALTARVEELEGSLRDLLRLVDEDQEEDAPPYLVDQVLDRARAAITKGESRG